VRGNWHNAVHIECDSCATDCSGFLLGADRDAKPVLISVDSLKTALCEPVEPSECIGVISRQTFESLYAPWLLWEIDDPNSCSLRQVAAKTGQHASYADFTRIGG